MKHVGINLVD